MCFNISFSSTLTKSKAWSAIPILENENGTENKVKYTYWISNNKVIINTVIIDSILLIFGSNIFVIKLISRIIGIVNNISNLIKNIEYTVEEYNKADADGRAKYRKWINDKINFAEAGYAFTEPAPIRDFSSVDYGRLNYPIIDIAKKLVNYTAIKNELNSINAEGNLSSDIIENSWITNLLKQIAYSNEEDSNAGLNRLLEEVTKGEQYRYTPLFWGVKDSKGKYLSEGLFMRDSSGNVKVNPRARSILQVSLFNGIKDDESGKSAMYDRMSKGDYFLTNLYAFHNPISIGENIAMSTKDLNDKFAGYFMRTPSDAPKNFIIQAPKLKTNGVISTVSSSVKAYLDKRRGEIALFGFRDGETSKYQDEHDDYVIGNSKITKNQKWSAADIYDIFTGNIDNIKYNNMYSILNEDGTVPVPIVYDAKEEKNIVSHRGRAIEALRIKESNYQKNKEGKK